MRVWTLGRIERRARAALELGALALHRFVGCNNGDAEKRLKKSQSASGLVDALTPAGAVYEAGAQMAQKKGEKGWAVAARDRISLQIEPNRHGEIDALARQFAWRRRERLRAPQQSQRLFVERARAR
jgi:hypothetical protein